MREGGSVGGRERGKEGESEEGKKEGEGRGGDGCTTSFPGKLPFPK